jgi:membrane protease YdiL (CAAX protease family)
MRNFRKIMTVGGIHFDLRLTLIIVMGTLLPMMDYYNHRITGTKAYDRLILYFVIPMLVMLLLLRDRPADYGFQLGNWRKGLVLTFIACAAMAAILWFVAREPSMQKFYAAKAPDNPLYLIYITAVDLIGWEFMWRGFMLFGMAAVLGPGAAIWLQAVPFAFMHLNKPELEALTTLFGGAAFGYVAWQTGSFVYPLLIHWFIASFTMLVASGKLG